MLTYIRNRFHPLWRLRQFGLFRAFQQYFDPDWSCKIEGVSVSLKLIRDFSVILPHGGKEIESTKAFRKAMEDYGINLFFDIGANIGSYSWVAAAKGDVEIFAVEADVTNQRLLAKTIRRNGLKNCHLVPVAMSDSVGTAKFLVDRASGTTGSLKDDTSNDHSLHFKYGMNEFVTVRTLMLDIFTEYAKNKKTMLKIDVEGAEESVFRGAVQFIKEVRPVILVECFERTRLKVIERENYSVTSLRENYNYLLEPMESGKNPITEITLNHSGAHALKQRFNE